LYDDLRTDQGDASADAKLAMARHFAEAISAAARENLPRQDYGRFVSTVRDLTRAQLEIGPHRRAA
jgi:hypothetical protein